AGALVDVDAGDAVEGESRRAVAVVAGLGRVAVEAVGARIALVGAVVDGAAVLVDAGAAVDAESVGRVGAAAVEADGGRRIVDAGVPRLRDDAGAVGRGRAAGIGMDAGRLRRVAVFFD